MLVDGLEARVARLEGEVSQIVKRLDGIDNWLRVIVGIQITTLVALITATAIIVNLLT